MIKIGTFSVLSKISIYMLRHYDEIGLLKPAGIDEESGYRYYSEDQLTIAGQIRALKDMGIGLVKIKSLLGEENRDKLKEALNARAKEQREQIRQMAIRLRQIETTLSRLDAAYVLPQSGITLKEIPRRQIACLKGTLPCYEAEGLLWQQLTEEIKRQQLTIISPGGYTAIYEEEADGEGIIAEVQCSVSGIGRPGSAVTFKTIAPIMAAAITFRGDYPLIGNARQQLKDWIADNQYAAAGKIFNIYHRSPATEPDWENLVTEVCCPVKEV